MRWMPLLAVALVAACFNPAGKSAEGSSDGSATAGSTTATNPTTSATSTPATTSTTTPEASTTASSPTTTTGTTGTTDVGSTTTGDPTTIHSCNPPCGTCEVCADNDQCVLAPNTECTPSPDPCEGTIGGLAGNACVKAVLAGGTCDDKGSCVAKCVQGPVHVQCIDAGCVRPDNLCKVGAPVASVSIDNFCFMDDMPHPGCDLKCNDITGDLDALNCIAEGKCSVVNTKDCLTFNCNNNIPDCRTACVNDNQCAEGYGCDNNMCI